MTRAIVIGASVTGILTSKVLSNYFDEVVVIERDELPVEPQIRKGIPQSNQLHVLLLTGFEIMKRYFPELPDLLEEKGSYVQDIGLIYWYQFNRWKLVDELGVKIAFQTRPIIDWALLKLLRDVDNVRVMDSTSVDDLIIQDKKVVGVKIGVDELLADFVVDASGKGSHTPKWLLSHGIGEVDTEKIRVDVKYVSRDYALPKGYERSFPSIMVNNDPPRTKRVGVLFRVENRIQVTLVGVLNDHPPTDEEGFVEFAKNLDDPIIYDVIKNLKPLTKPRGYGYPYSIWRRYDRMVDLPSNFLVVGDANFNVSPVYAQGMTLSGVTADTLDGIFRSGPSLEKVSDIYYSSMQKKFSGTWRFSTVDIKKFPEVAGKRSTMDKFQNFYSKQVALASTDPVIYRTFLQVMNFTRSPVAMMSPLFMLRLLFVRIFGRKKLVPDLDRILEMSRNEPSIPENLYM